MSVSADVHLRGVKESLKELGKIDPALRRQFTKDVQRVAAPAVDKAAQAYRFVPLSGMNRTWAGPAVNGRKVFPFDLKKARRGVRARVDTRRGAGSTIYIEQRDPAAAIFETAGRANPGNPLAQSLGDIPSPNTTRLMGRVVYAMRREVEQEIVKLVRRVEYTVNGRLK